MRQLGICTVVLFMVAGLVLGQESKTPPQEAAPLEEVPDPETEAVRLVFEAYKRALLEGDGQAAAALVDASTLSYFGAIKDLAMSGSEEEVKARAFVDRLLIVTMRHELEVETLESMDLEGLLRHAIESGWIAKASIRRLDIGEITIDGDTARGVAKTAGAIPAPAEPGAEPLSYAFIREDGVWKFGFSSLVASLNKVITDFAQQMGANEDDLIFTLVQALSGRQVLPEIWSAPGAPGSR